MRRAPPIPLADHRAQRLVTRLLDVQSHLEDASVEPERADALFTELERLLEELSRNAQHVRSARLRQAIARACAAHERWWGAVSTSAERSAVMRYLRSVEALARAAQAATGRAR